MMKVVSFILFLFLIVSCSEKVPEKEDVVVENNSEQVTLLKEEIKNGEERLMEMSKKGAAIDDVAEARKLLNNSLLKFYRAFPENDFAPVCLDRVHFSYSAMRNYEMATMYGDTLLMSYPKYINRPMVLESQANAYDMLIEPRDTMKVRYYNEMLLKENPDLPKEQVEGIHFKLNHLELSFEEIVMLRQKEGI